MIKLISTKRLYFFPVTLTDLQWNAGKESDPHIKNDYLSIIEKGSSDEGNELWYTIWEIRRKNDDAMVGAFRFFGPPNENFEAGVDLNIRDEYSGKGYGSEALGGIIDFLFSFKSCSYIQCLIERGDNAAVRFIKRFGFVKEADSTDAVVYELEKKKKNRTLPLMTAGFLLTFALRFMLSSMEWWMWLIAPSLFLIGLVQDFFDSKRRKIK